MSSRIYRPGYLGTKTQFPRESLACVATEHLQLDRSEARFELKVSKSLTTGKVTGVSMEYPHYKVRFTAKDGFKVERKSTGRSSVIKSEILNQWDPSNRVIPVCLFRQEILCAAKTNPSIAELVRENREAFTK